MTHFLKPLLGAALALAAAGAATAADSTTTTLRRFDSTPEEGNPWTLRIDSVMMRDDVTRVYGALKGPANRSGRIDAIQAKDTNRIWDATDIDGIDFKRWFQWEEDGIIMLEIDFNPGFRPVKGRWVISAPTNLKVLNWTVTTKKSK